MIDYDKIDDWAPSLSQALANVVPSSAHTVVAAQAPEYEDAMACLFTLASREQLIATTLEWIEANTIAAYHGSRLSEEEIRSIQQKGLLPLIATSRRKRLARALSPHQKWPLIEPRLDVEIDAHGQGNRAGAREGQVHLTLSRAGLVSGFSHYLVHGSEFDQRVAHSLLGREGLELLEKDGISVVFQIELTGSQALSGAHHYFTVEDLKRMGEVPNLVKEYLEAWSYRIANPSFQTDTLKVDCGIWFREAVPPGCIREISPALKK